MKLAEGGQNTKRFSVLRPGEGLAGSRGRMRPTTVPPPGGGVGGGLGCPGVLL